MYRTEFPDFDHELPAIAGWHDTSWGNETCPSLQNADGTLVLWVDYLDLAKREYDDGKVYTLNAVDEAGEQDNICATDDLEEALLAVDNAMAAKRAERLLIERLAEERFGKASHDDVVRLAEAVAAELGLVVTVDPETQATRWEKA